MVTKTEVRTDMCDYPTGWRIQDEIGTASPPHHRRCSCVPDGEAGGGPMFLCDCNEVLREWRRRVKEQTGQNSDRYVFADTEWVWSP